MGGKDYHGFAKPGNAQKWESQGFAYGTFLSAEYSANWGNVGKNYAVRILVVDDHADTNLAVAKLLAQKGYEVRTAQSCSAAIEAAQAGGVDLLLCDLGLPDGDGCDLLRGLRSAYGLDGIAISGSGEPIDLARCKEAGFAAHILKPIQFEHLTTMIESVLARRQGG